MVKLTDLDYFLSYDKIVYLVKGYYHLPGAVFAYPVFWPDPKGERLHPQWGRYSKDVSDFNKRVFKIHPEYQHDFIPSNTPLIPRKHILEIFHPRYKVKYFLEREKGSIWYQLFQYITKDLSVPPEDVGIFGSYLVDLHKNIDNKQIKDIDLVIYGLENMLKVKNGIEKLLNQFGFSYISRGHILHHENKFGKYFDPKINSFKKTLANKWSSIQVAPGILATLRFVYKSDEIPPNPIIAKVKSFFRVKGIVENDIGTNFVPRIFTIKARSKTYRVATYFWGFQACVKQGDIVLVTGNLHGDEKTISVDSPSHGIKILS